MAFETSIQRIEALAVNADPPLRLGAASPVREVLAAMRESGSGYALLESGDRLVGILTERDVLTKVLGHQGVLEAPVSAVMTPEPVCVQESDPVRMALHVMRKGGFRHIPVVDGECRVVGCIRHKDVVRYLVEHVAAQVLNIPPDPDQIATTQEGG